MQSRLHSSRAEGGGSPGRYGETGLGARLSPISNAAIRSPHPGPDNFQLILG